MIGSIDYMEEHIKEIMEHNKKYINIDYDISDVDIEDIADRLFDNECIWECINDAIEYELQKYEKKTGLIKNSDGSLIYKTKNNTYSLLEGFTNNNLKSDILFIYKEPTFKENDAIPGEIVNFMYGGFSEENLKDVETIINNYEKENGLC